MTSGFNDGTIKPWDFATGKEQNTVNALSHAFLNKPSPQLSLKEDWVSFGDERCLWLPSEHRRFQRMVTQDGILALGYGDGKVIIVRFC